MISQYTNDEPTYKRGRNLSAFYSYVWALFFFVVYIAHRAPRNAFYVAHDNKGKQIYKHHGVMNAHLVDFESGILVYCNLLEQRNNGSGIGTANKTDHKTKKTYNERMQGQAVLIYDLVGYCKEHNIRSH